MTDQSLRGAEDELASIPIFGGTGDTGDAGTGTSGAVWPNPWSITSGDSRDFGFFDRSELGERRDALPGQEVDWTQVVALRKESSELITAETQAYISDHGRPMPAEDRLLMGRSIIRRVVGDHVRALHREGSAMWSTDTEFSYIAAVEDAVFGFGRLQPLFDIPDAENIEIHGWDNCSIQYGDGHRETHPPVADSDEELVDAIRFLGENAEPSRPFDDTHPTMTLALGNKFRLHAIGFGLSFRPSIVIRQHILTDVSLAQLANGGLMSGEAARFLDAAILARKSIVISGDQGAGKTTLLRALINAIPDNERFGTLETDYELMTHLQPGRHNMLALQARTGHGERDGGQALGDFSIADLMPEALRQNLSRLVVGEVRGGEAGAMFEAMQAGAGTLSTTHSHSAESTIDRLASRVAQGGVLTIDEAYRQIAHNIHLFVYVKLVDDTWRGGSRRRFISEIRQVTRSIESGRPVTHLTYRCTDDGTTTYFPDADFQDELSPFFRALPGSTAQGDGRP